MTRRNTQPLITVALFAYNQEQYVQQAIEGILAQTYSPLEVILSDDCSTDRTYTVLRSAAAEYRGPHQLVLNRNESNLGVCGHVNRVCEIARGEWLVAAAGDDISLPERVEVLADCIRRHPAAAYATSQATTFTDESSAQAEDGNMVSQALGATEAFRLSVFREFGPLQNDTFSEDWALYFRAQLKGEVIFVEHPLVRYRVSATSLTSSFTKGGLSGKLRIHRANLRQFEADLKKVYRPGQSGDSLISEIATRLKLCELLLQRIDGKTICTKSVICMMKTESVLRRVRLGLLALFVAPGIYFCSERLRKSRLRMFSPTHHGLSFLNPQSLLRPVVSCCVDRN